MLRLRRWLSVTRDEVLIAATQTGTFSRAQELVPAHKVPRSGSVLDVVGEDAVIHHPAVRGEDSDSL